MMLEEDILESIDWYIRATFWTDEQILREICDEYDMAGEDEIKQVEGEISKRTLAHKSIQNTWPASTDCDKLDSAFEKLNRLNIFARQNYGRSLSDGMNECMDAKKENSELRGYCFYHEQDLESAMTGDGFYLASAAYAGADAENLPMHIDVIREICKVLEAEGLQVVWDGDVDRRIFLQNFDWKRR